jgi:hypothetical protein
VYNHARFIGWDGVLANFLPRLTLNIYPPHLCLLSKWDYRFVPPWLTLNDFLKNIDVYVYLYAQIHHRISADFIRSVSVSSDHLPMVMSSVSAEIAWFLHFL